jgi:carbon monoxide dehydrogenase subunit G
MKIESSIIRLNKEIDEVYNTLCKASTYEKLMPSEASFTMADEDHFSFKLSGMPVIPLKMKSKLPNKQIVLASDGGSVHFELQANFELIENNTKVQLVFKGELNPMMQMIVKKPLTQFLESLSENLKNL